MKRASVQPTTQQLIIRMVRDADALKHMTRKELRSIHIFLTSVREMISDAIHRAEAKHDEH